MEAQTQSGRLYRLLGDPGRDRDALYVFDVWLLNQQPRRIRDQSVAFMRLRRQRGMDDEGSRTQASGGKSVRSPTPR